MCLLKCGSGEFIKENLNYNVDKILFMFKVKDISVSKIILASCFAFCFMLFVDYTLAFILHYQLQACLCKQRGAIRIDNLDK